MPSPLLAVLLLACADPDAGGAATPPSSAPSPGATGPAAHAGADLVLVTLDTTRADRLGAYGYDRGGTDWIDAKAAAGWRFDRATSVLPLTIPSHASILTGLYPFHHGIRSNGDAVLAPEHLTLAERLDARGWWTCASVAAFVTSRDWGFDQGFDWFYDRIPESPAGGPGGGPGTGPAADRSIWHQERPADAVVDDAITCLDRAPQGQPLFLWVHLYDAHFPYAPPQPYAEAFEGRPYDGELAFLDDQLARLEAALSARGRQPLWALIGDHGESLGQHRELTHGLFVYEATQHVPLILAGPGLEPRILAEPVSQVDLLPTLLELLGLPQAEGLDGRAQPAQARPIYAESYQLVERYGYAPQVAVVDGDLKLVDKPRPELYDVARDPREQEDLARARPAEVARLRQALADLGSTPPTRRSEPLDPDAVARLEALGYLAGGDFDVDLASLPDPLDHLQTLERLQRAEVWQQGGELQKAREALEAVLAEEPALPGLHARLARLLDRLGQPERALQVLTEGRVHRPDDVGLLLTLAALHGRQGDHAAAEALSRRVLELDPDNRQATEYLMGAMLSQGQVDRLFEHARAHLARDPEAAHVAGLAGSLAYDLGDLASAAPWLSVAARADRPRAGVCRRLATIARAQGQDAQARVLLERELSLHPADTDAAVLLAHVLAAEDQHEAVLTLLDRVEAGGARATDRMLLARGASLLDLGRGAQALGVARDAVAAHPDDPALALLLANALLATGDRQAAEEARGRALALHAAREGGASATP